MYRISAKPVPSQGHGRTFLGRMRTARRKAWVLWAKGDSDRMKWREVGRLLWKAERNLRLRNGRMVFGGLAGFNDFGSLPTKDEVRQLLNN